jgi:hypothetical protein
MVMNPSTSRWPSRDSTNVPSTIPSESARRLGKGSRGRALRTNCYTLLRAAAAREGRVTCSIRVRTWTTSRRRSCDPNSDVAATVLSVWSTPRWRLDLRPSAPLSVGR